MSCKLVSLVLVLASLFLVSPGVSAQQSASSGLVGQVTDSSQGAIPGATGTVSTADDARNMQFGIRVAW